MKSLSDFSVHHAVTVLVLTGIIIVAGVYAYMTLPRESAPDITIPNILVSAHYEGVAPSDIENLITEEIEKKLITISDIKEIRSYSSEGACTIIVEFDSGIDIDTAFQKVQDKVKEARSELPDDLDDPTVNEINFAEFPIMSVILSGPVGAVRLKEIADDLVDEFEAVTGVLEATVTGGLEREIRVVYEPERLASYQLPVASLMQTVRANNLNTPGGDLDIGQGNYLVKIPGEFNNPEEAKRLIVRSNQTHSIFLTDVAQMRDGFEEPKTKARLNRHEAVSIAVVKRSGENIIEISNEIKQILKRIEPTLPAGTEVSITSDQSKDIVIMVGDLENSILSGLILVLIVVLFAMGFRNAIIVASAIPMSMLITFVVLKMIGLTLNMVVLFSLVLAVGMLVDNAIVVVENIYRHRQEGKSRQDAAVAGSKEVMWPVLASAATTIAAFFPMIFWPGIVGEFMSYLPKTVIIALAASLFVALVINPTLCSIFMRVKGKHRKEQNQPSFFMRGYRKIVQGAVQSPLFTILSTICFMICVMMLYSVKGKGMEFFPETEPKRAYIDITMPTGTNMEETDRLVTLLEPLSMDYDEVESIVSNVGSKGSGSMSSLGMGGSDSPNEGRISIEFVDLKKRKISASQILAEIREKLDPFYEAEIQIEKEEEGPPTGAPVTVEIIGEKYTVLEPIMRTIKERIQGIPGLVNMKDDYVVSLPEIVVQVDKERAALLGLDTLQVATNVKAAIRGIEAGVYRDGNEEFDIIVQLPRERRKDMFALNNLIISGINGQQVPISSVADITLSAGLGTIVRIDQDRVITIEAEAEGRLGNDVLADVQAALTGLELPPGYRIDYKGESEDQEEASEFLSEAFIAALMMIALILVTEFNSIYKPFIVLCTVILATMGVFIGLLITGKPFGLIMTGIGVISLAGVVVNNAIVLIDYVGQLRQRGLSDEESLIQAGMIRFRPVILTAVTTILGLIPMAIGISYDFRSGGWQVGSVTAQMWGPMAVAVIFGLTIATVLTLVVVPSMVSLGDKTLDIVHVIKDKLGFQREDDDSIVETA